MLQQLATRLDKLRVGQIPREGLARVVRQDAHEHEGIVLP